MAEYEKMMKGDLTKLMEDRNQHPALVEMTEAGFLYVATEGKYMVLVDVQGVTRYYDPKLDQVLPFIERREDYSN